MRKHTFLPLFISSTIMAGSLSACTTEALGVVRDIAHDVLKFLSQGNKARIEMSIASESGIESRVTSDQVEAVTINGRSVRHSFNAQGELVLEDFELSDRVEAEAAVQLKGVDRPVVVVIAPREQQRSDMQLTAKVAVAEVGNQKVLLNTNAEAVKTASQDSLALYQKSSVIISTGQNATQLRGKKIIGAWLDGDRLPHSQCWVDANGRLLIHVSIFRRFLMGVKPELNQTTVINKTVTIRTETYKKVKTVLRKKILKERQNFVRRQVVVEGSIKTEVVNSNSFRSQALPSNSPVLDFSQAQIPTNIQLTAEQQVRVQEELQQRKRDTTARVVVKGQALTEIELASLRGTESAKLVTESNYYKDHTLYILAQGSDGAMTLCKFYLNANLLKSVSAKVDSRIRDAKAEAEVARSRLANLTGQSQERLEQEASQVAEETAISANVNIQGDLLLDAVTERIDANASVNIKLVSSVQNAEQVIQSEELEEELEDELSPEMGDVLASGEKLELALDDQVYASASAEAGIQSGIPAEEIVTEDTINLDTEIRQAQQQSHEVQIVTEEVVKEEVFVSSQSSSSSSTQVRT